MQALATGNELGFRRFTGQRNIGFSFLRPQVKVRKTGLSFTFQSKKFQTPAPPTPCMENSPTVPNFRYFDLRLRHIMFWADSTRPMNAFFDLGRYLGWWPKMTPVLLVFVAVVAAGCSKSSSQPAAAPPVPPPSADSAPVSSTPAPAVMPANSSPTTSTNSGPTTLQMLNRALIHWMIKNRRHPQNFEDFANSANIQIPDPPAGKKYTLNGRGFIVLVDNQ